MSMYKEGCGCPHKWAKMKEQLADIRSKNGIMNGKDSGGKMVKIVIIKGPKMLKAQANNITIWKRLQKLKEGFGSRAVEDATNVEVPPEEWPREIQQQMVDLINKHLQKLAARNLELIKKANKLGLTPAEQAELKNLKTKEIPRLQKMAAQFFNLLFPKPKDMEQPPPIDPLAEPLDVPPAPGKPPKLKEGLVKEFVPKPGTHGRPLWPQLPGGPGRYGDYEEWERKQAEEELKRAEDKLMREMAAIKKRLAQIEAYQKYITQKLKEMDMIKAGEEPPPGSHWEGGGIQKSTLPYNPDPTGAEPGSP